MGQIIRDVTSFRGTDIHREENAYFATGELDRQSVFQGAALGGFDFEFDYDARGQLVRTSGSADNSNAFAGHQVTPRDVWYDYEGGQHDEPSLRFAGQVERLERLVSVDSTAVNAEPLRQRFNAAGDVTARIGSEGTTHHRYDGQGQLRESIAPDGTRELYFYNGPSRRVLELTIPPGTSEPSRIRFWMDGTEIWYGGAGVVQKTLVHLSLGTRVGRIENRTNLTVESANGLGHVTASVEPAGGTLAAGFVYSPFGELLASAGTGTEDHLQRFNGKEYSPATNLSYYGWRYYDPLTMQWTQADPLYRFEPDVAWDDPRRAALYTFALNNPMKYIDPDGRDVYIFTWAPDYEKRQVGHSAIGVTQRDKNGQPTGNIVVRDLWGPGVQPNRLNVPADYRQTIIHENDIGKFEGGAGLGGNEERPADGILRVQTSESEEMDVSNALDRREVGERRWDHDENNCADYSSAGLAALGIAPPEKRKVKTQESLDSGIVGWFIGHTVRTPVSVHRNLENKDGVTVEKPLVRDKRLQDIDGDRLREGR